MTDGHTARPLILASASPRRAELLRQIDIRFDIVTADVDETPHPEEAPGNYVERLAIAKASAIAREHPGALVLGADTTVVCDDQILGKPLGEADALDMLMRLSGRRHEVMTGVCVTDGMVMRSQVVTTAVLFAQLDRARALRYWRTGEGADKAGGYGIQGIGGILADRIEGSYSAVVGLPLRETEEMLEAFGYDTWQNR